MDAGTRTERRLSLFEQVLLAILTAWALLVIAPDLTLIVNPMASFGFQSDNDGEIYDVRGPFPSEKESPAWQKGIKEGDRLNLSAMRCLPPSAPNCTDLLQILGGMGGTQWAPVGQQVTLILDTTNAEARTVTLTAALPPRNWITKIVYFLNGIVAISLILSAAWLVRAHPGPMTWGFFLYIIWFNSGQYNVFYSWLKGYPWLLILQESLQALAQGFGYAGLVLFAICAPYNRVDPRCQSAKLIVPLLGAVLSLMHLLSFANIFGLPTETLAEATYAAGYSVDIVAFSVLMLRRKGLPPHDYQRMTWIVWGSLIGLSAFIFADSNDTTGFWAPLWDTLGQAPEWAFGLLYLLNGVFGWFVFSAVSRPRVVSVAIPLTSITILGLVFSPAIYYLHHLVDHHLSTPTWSWIVIGGLVVFGLQWVHDRLVHVADHLFRRSRHRAKKQLDEAGMKILDAGSFSEVEKLLTKGPVHALDLSSAAVFRRIDGEHVFQRHEDAVGWDSGTMTLGTSSIARLNVLLEAERTNAFRRLLSATCRPVEGVFRRHGSLSRQSAKSAMTSGHAVQGVATPKSGCRARRLVPGALDLPEFPGGLQAPTFVVPIEDRRRIFALAFYGPRQSGADLDSEDHAALTKFASHAVAAYHCAEIADLRNRIRELEERLNGFCPAS